MREGVVVNMRCGRNERGKTGKFEVHPGAGRIK